MHVEWSDVPSQPPGAAIEGKGHWSDGSSHRVRAYVFDAGIDEARDEIIAALDEWHAHYHGARA
jgi:hypothetical protein